jgi:hypothetical protein
MSRDPCAEPPQCPGLESRCGGSCKYRPQMGLLFFAVCGSYGCGIERAAFLWYAHASATLGASTAPDFQPAALKASSRCGSLRLYSVDDEKIMKIMLYILGGIILWLGVYAYLKTRNSMGLSPIPGTRANLLYQASGLLGHVAMLAYLITMVIVFKWWLVPVFFVAGGLLTGIIYGRLETAGAGLAIICVPLGIVLAVIGLAV